MTPSVCARLRCFELKPARDKRDLDVGQSLASRSLIVCQTMGYIEKTLGGEEEPFIAKASFHRLYHGLPMECWSTL